MQKCKKKKLTLTQLKTHINATRCDDAFHSYAMMPFTKNNRVTKSGAFSFTKRG